MKSKKEKSIRATFMPDWRAGNPYQDLLAKSLRQAGAEVDFFEMPRGILALNRLPRSVLTSQVIHLHWINSLVDHIIWPQSILSRRFKLFCLYIDIVLLRLRGLAVVWTIHNVVSHESINVPVEIEARRVIARACSHVLIHSKSALKRVEKDYGYVFGDKVSVTPIGNYDGCYQDNDALGQAFKEKYSVSETDINIMFFGAVRRYKGVQQLVEAFRATNRPNLRLIVAGKPNAADLTHILEEAAAADSRITLILEFVPDNMVVPMLRAVDAVVIPFERTLTSASTVLAMTLSKATLLPVDAQVFDLVDERSCLFFTSLPDLTSIMDRLDKQDLLQRGAEARRQADSLQWPAIGRLAYRGYEKALGH